MPAMINDTAQASTLSADEIQDVKDQLEAFRLTVGKRFTHGQHRALLQELASAYNAYPADPEVARQLQAEMDGRRRCEGELQAAGGRIAELERYDKDGSLLSILSACRRSSAHPREDQHRRNLLSLLPYIAGGSVRLKRNSLILSDPDRLFGGERSDLFASVRLLFGVRPARGTSAECTPLLAKDTSSVLGDPGYRKRDIDDLLREAVVFPHNSTQTSHVLTSYQDTNNDLVLDGFDHMTDLQRNDADAIMLYSRQFASVLLSSLAPPPPAAADGGQPYSQFVILHKPITLQQPAGSRRFELGGDFLETAIRRYVGQGNNGDRPVLRMAGLIYQGDHYSVFHICPRTRYVTCVLWPIQSSSQADQGGIFSQSTWRDYFEPTIERAYPRRQNDSSWTYAVEYINSPPIQPNITGPLCILLIQILLSTLGQHGTAPLRAGEPNMPTFDEDMPSFASNTAIAQISYLESLGQLYKRLFEKASSGTLRIDISELYDSELL